MASNKNMSSLLNVSGLTQVKERQAPISAIYLTSITFIIVAGNILTLNVVCRKRLKPADVLLGCLAMADLLTALFVFPLLITYSITGKWPGGLVLCYINTFSSVAFLKFSMLLASWIAVDRFLAIAKPFLYRSKVNMRKTLLFAASTLAYSILVALLPVTGMATFGVEENIIERSWCVYHWAATDAKDFSTAYVILNLIDSTFALLVVLVSNISVIVYFVKRKRRKRKIAPAAEAPVMESSDKKVRRAKEARSDLRYAHLMGIASFYFTLSFLPVQVLIVLHHYGWTRLGLCTVISFQLHVASVNLLFNPLLYGLIRKHYRRAYWFIVKHPLLLCGRSTDHPFDFDAGHNDLNKRQMNFRQLSVAALASSRLRSLASSRVKREQGHDETRINRRSAESNKQPTNEGHLSTERRDRVLRACSVGSECGVCRQDSLSSAFLQVPDSSYRRDSGSSYFSTTELESLPPTPGYLATPSIMFPTRLGALSPGSDTVSEQLTLTTNLTHGRPSLASFSSVDYQTDETERWSQITPDPGLFMSSTGVSVEPKDNKTAKLPRYLPPILVTSASPVEPGTKPQHKGHSRSFQHRFHTRGKTVEANSNEFPKLSSTNFHSAASDNDIFEIVKPAEEVFDIVTSDKKFRKKKRKRRKKKVAADTKGT